MRVLVSCCRCGSVSLLYESGIENLFTGLGKRVLSLCLQGNLLWEIALNKLIVLQVLFSSTESSFYCNILKVLGKS